MKNTRDLKIFERAFGKACALFLGNTQEPFLLKKISRLEELYQTVSDRRQKKGLPVIRDAVVEGGDEEGAGISTEAGTYLATDLSYFTDLLPFFQFPGGKGLVLDAGSGLGKFVLRLAVLKREIPRIVGIEHDCLLYEESCEALKEAVCCGIIRRGRVEFFQGDFNDSRFAPLFQKANVVYYYHKGTDHIDRLAATLQKNLKPSARVVCYRYGKNKDPFIPFLARKDFKRVTTPCVTTYERY